MDALPYVDPALAAAAAAAAYALGSINFSLVAAKLAGHGDLRAAGSGNAGATNLSRVAGPKVAIPVLVLDIARGAGVVAAASALGLGAWAPVAALPLLLGNLFPVFHGFRGGKGVAASVGAMAIVCPWAMLAGGGAFGLAFAISRRVSVGSLAMAASWPISTSLLGGATLDWIVALGLALLLFASHRKNLARLAAGQEPSFFAKAKREENL